MPPCSMCCCKANFQSRTGSLKEQEVRQILRQHECPECSLKTVRGMRNGIIPSSQRRHFEGDVYPLDRGNDQVTHWNALGQHPAMSPNSRLKTQADTAEVTSNGRVKVAKAALRRHIKTRAIPYTDSSKLDYENCKMFRRNAFQKDLCLDTSLVTTCHQMVSPYASSTLAVKPDSQQEVLHGTFDPNKVIESDPIYEEPVTGHCLESVEQKNHRSGIRKAPQFIPATPIDLTSHTRTAANWSYKPSTQHDSPQQTLSDNSNPYNDSSPLDYSVKRKKDAHNVSQGSVIRRCPNSSELDIPNSSGIVLPLDTHEELIYSDVPTYNRFSGVFKSALKKTSEMADLLKKSPVNNGTICENTIKREEPFIMKDICTVDYDLFSSRLKQETDSLKWHNGKIQRLPLHTQVPLARSAQLNVSDQRRTVQLRMNQLDSAANYPSLSMQSDYSIDGGASQCNTLPSDGPETDERAVGDCMTLATSGKVSSSRADAELEPVYLSKSAMSFGMCQRYTANSLQTERPNYPTNVKYVHLGTNQQRPVVNYPPFSVQSDSSIDESSSRCSSLPSDDSVDTRNDTGKVEVGDSRNSANGMVTSLNTDDNESESFGSAKGRRLFECAFCGFKTTKRNYLKSHTDALHKGLKPFECDICDFKTGYKYYLKHHTDTVHERAKSFDCAHCDFKTAYKYYLKHHTDTVHEKSKYFECSLCKFMTPNKFHLKRHVQNIHEKSKSFKCTLCDFKTAYNFSLKCHTNAVHKGLKPFKCAHCDFSAAQKSNLKLHVSNVHNQ